MSQPFAYVGTWTIKPGKEEDAKTFLSEHTAFIEANEPRMIAFHVYFNEEGNMASVVQVHPDSASMETHMQLIAEHMGSAFEVNDRILSEQYFGPMPTHSHRHSHSGKRLMWRSPSYPLMSRGSRARTRRHRRLTFARRQLDRRSEDLFGTYDDCEHATRPPFRRWRGSHLI
jgi:hypothetical protein